MITILIGELTDYNIYHETDITSKFPQALVIKRNTSKGFKAWFSNIKRPIIGDRVLVHLTETYPLSRRDFDSFRTILEELKEHNYVDILWSIPQTRGNFNDIITSMNLILLRRTYKSDFIQYASKKFPNTNVDTIKYFLKSIAYNQSLFNLYEKEFEEIYKTKGTFTNIDVDQTVTNKQLRPIMDVLYENLTRQNKGLREYYNYCQKYGKTWVNNFYIDSLEEVIKLKVQYYKENSVTIADIRSSDRNRKYVKLIVDIPISDVYTLLTLLKSNKYPIEMYKNNTTKDIITSVW